MQSTQAFWIGASSLLRIQPERGRLVAACDDAILSRIHSINGFFFLSNGFFVDNMQKMVQWR
jgi:hypothetical protein